MIEAVVGRAVADLASAPVLVERGCTAGQIVTDAWSAVWCPYAEAARLGMAGVGLLFAFAGTAALQSWSDGVTVPGAWLALMLSFVVATIPGAFATRAVALVSIVAILGGVGIWKTLRG